MRLTKGAKTRIAELVASIEELKLENHQARASLRSVTEQRDHEARRAETAESRTFQLMKAEVQHVPWEHPRLYRVEVKVDAGPFRFHAADFVQMISRELTGKLLDAFNKGGF